MNAPPLIERASIDEIRARAEVPVFNQLSGPKEYYRVQQLLRDRADLLSHYDELAKRPVPEPKAKLPDWEAEYKKLAPVYTREGLETFIADHWPGNRLIDVIAEKSGGDHG